jgi:hypothetical protein
MKTKSKAYLLVVQFFFFILVALSNSLFAGPLSVSPPGKLIATKKTKHVVTTLVNDAGKLKGGVNDFCVLFRDPETNSALDFQNVSADFRQLVGRIEEVPITVPLSKEEAGRYCGRVNLGRQYYSPSSYYAFVHYVTAIGKRKSSRLFVSVK